MIIGIDASHLNPLNMSGTQTYLYSLLRNIALIDDTNTYYVYTRYPVTTAFFSEMTCGKPNFTCIALQSKLSWTQHALAFRTFKDKPNVLFCPWQTMPVIHYYATRIVGVIHGLEYSFLRFCPTFYTALFSDKLIGVSNFTKASLLTKIPFLNPKLSVIYEGVDAKHFHKLAKNNITPVLAKYNINSSYIFFVGYMVARKNIERLLVAYAKYHKRVSNPTNLVLGGKVPPESQYLLQLPEKLGIAENVQFLGYVPEDDLPALLSGAQALSYVSLSEGFGLPPLEAMACQTPVLSSLAGALPEVCSDAALLVDPLNIDAISNGIEEILSDAALRKKLVLRGLMNIQKFDWSITARQVLDILIAQEA